LIKKIVVNSIVIVIISALIFSLYKLRFLPDIFLILTVFGGIFYGPYYGLVFGFFSGLAFDVSSFGLVGFNSLIYMIIGYLTVIPEKKFDIKNVFISCIIVFIFMLIKGVLFLITGLLFMKSTEVISYFRDVFFIQLLITVAFTIPIYFIYRKINELTGSIRKNE
jgi:rod shape-determining protein MreD